MLSAFVSLSRMLWLNMALNTGDLKHISKSFVNRDCCRAGAESRWTEIMNFGSGSFLNIKDLKQFYRKKIMVAKENFVN
jgi:hypothetical protein